MAEDQAEVARLLLKDADQKPAHAQRGHGEMASGKRAPIENQIEEPQAKATVKQVRPIWLVRRKAGLLKLLIGVVVIPMGMGTGIVLLSSASSEALQRFLGFLWYVPVLAAFCLVPVGFAETVGGQPWGTIRPALRLILLPVGIALYVLLMWGFAASLECVDFWKK